MEKPVWDYESAMKRVMKKEKLLVRLAGLFIDDMPKRIEELKSAIEEEPLMELVLDEGVNDILTHDEEYELLMDPNHYPKIMELLLFQNVLRLRR